MSSSEEEDLPDYMRVKEIFSFENMARIHRELEQIKDVVREMRGVQIPNLQKENAELKEQNTQLKKENDESKKENNEFKDQVRALISSSSIFKD